MDELDTTRAARIAVFGGGVGPRLAALALKEWRPELEVSLTLWGDEDLDGVEIASPPVLAFLHRYLGLGAPRLFAAAAPTWTLGLILERAGGRPSVPVPFGPVDPVDAWTHDGHLDRVSLSAQLMARGTAPLLRLGGATYSLLVGTEIGYHLERRALCGLLDDRAERLGLERHVLGDGEVETDGERVTGLRLRPGEDGARVAADLYVDAGGSPLPRLLGLVGSAFAPCGDALPWDGEVRARAPLEGLWPYTLAIGTPTGWCFAMPTRGALHLVSPFPRSDPSASATEVALRGRFPDATEVRVVPRRFGRFHDFIRHEVVGVGEGYGALPGLPGAGLHLLAGQLVRLLGILTRGRADGPRASAEVAGQWDQARDLLGLFDRLHTFDRAPIDHAEPARARALTLAREIASAQPADGRVTVFAAQAARVLSVTLAPGAPGGARDLPEPAVSECEWAELMGIRDRVIDAALPHAEALAEVEREQHLLEDQLYSDDGWCAAVAAQLRGAAAPRGRSRDALGAWARREHIQVTWASDVARLPATFPENPAMDFGKVAFKIPDAVLRPSTQAQLAECLRALSQRRIPFKLRGSGHTSGGQVLIEDGVVVDLRWLRRVVADDPSRELITVEGGMWFEELCTTLHRQGRWLPNLTMNWRVTVAGSLAVGGFGDTSHLNGMQVRLVREMVVMTLDGERHRVGPGDPLFDYSLCGRGQLGVIAEVTFETVRRPSGVVGRVIRWAGVADFLADARDIAEDGRFAILRGRVDWRDGAVEGAVGNFRDGPLDGERELVHGLRGRASPRLERFDYFEQSMLPKDEHWLPPTPATELVLPCEPDDIAGAARLVEEMRRRVVAAGLAERTPLGTSIMLLPTAGHPPLAPVPDAALGVMVAVRPELTPEDGARFDEAMEAIAAWGLEIGGRLYLIGCDPRTPEQLAKQFGGAFERFRELKRRFDPHGLLNPGLPWGA